MKLQYGLVPPPARGFVAVPEHVLAGSALPFRSQDKATTAPTTAPRHTAPPGTVSLLRARENGETCTTARLT